MNSRLEGHEVPLRGLHLRPSCISWLGVKSGQADFRAVPGAVLTAGLNYYTLGINGGGSKDEVVHPSALLFSLEKRGESEKTVRGSDVEGG